MFTRSWPKFSELLRRGWRWAHEGAASESHTVEGALSVAMGWGLGMVSGSRQLAPLLVMIPITKKQLEPAGCP